MRRQPGQVSQLTQHTHPRMRHHAMTVCRYFHPPRRRDILHLRSASPARADRTLDKSILHCETGTFAYQHPATDEPARKIQARAQFDPEPVYATMTAVAAARSTPTATWSPN